MARRVLAALAATVALVLGLSILAFGQTEPSPEEAAVAAATEWLALVDAAQYGESWDEASSFLRAAVTREDWERQVGAVRGALGAVRERKVRSRTSTTSLPGAPDGHYVVIELSTSFAQKAEAVETVTPRLEDGAWKVSGYYVR
jgi:hypothetical protein